MNLFNYFVILSFVLLFEKIERRIGTAYSCIIKMVEKLYTFIYNYNIMCNMFLYL